MIKKVLILMALTCLIAGCLGNEDGNKKPIASIVANNTIIFEGETIFFNGSGSHDPDGEIMEYKWDFGDGSFENMESCSHRFTSHGTFTVTLTVRDNKSAYGDSSIIITVKEVVNKLPIASIKMYVEKSVIHQGDTITFDSSESYDEDGEITKYSWDLGDGLLHEEESISKIFDEVGEFTIILTVTDNNRSVGTDSVIVNIEKALDFEIESYEHMNGFFVDTFLRVELRIINKGGRTLFWDDYDDEAFKLVKGEEEYIGHIIGDEEILPYSTETRTVDFNNFPEDQTPDYLKFYIDDNYNVNLNF
jgi:chitodextrinase